MLGRHLFLFVTVVVIDGQCVMLKDGHEVCFVGDEAFRILSQQDPHADSLLSAVSILYICCGVYTIHRRI